MVDRSRELTFGEWRPSLELRWYRRSAFSMDSVLQQKWQRPRMHGKLIHSWVEEWRDVPTVDG